MAKTTSYSTKKEYKGLGREFFTDPKKIDFITKVYEEGDFLLVEGIEAPVASDMTISLDRWGIQKNITFLDFVHVMQAIKNVYKRDTSFQTSDTSILFRDFLGRFVCRYLVNKKKVAYTNDLISKFGELSGFDLDSEMIVGEYDVFPTIETLKSAIEEVKNSNRISKVLSFYNSLSNKNAPIERKIGVFITTKLKDLESKLGAFEFDAEDIYRSKNQKKEKKDVRKMTKEEREANIKQVKDLLLSFINEVILYVVRIHEENNVSMTKYGFSILQKSVMLEVFVLYGASTSLQYLGRVLPDEENEDSKDNISNSFKIVYDFLAGKEGVENIGNQIPADISRALADYVALQFKTRSIFSLPSLQVEDENVGREHIAKSKNRKQFMFNSFLGKNAKNWSALFRKVYEEQGGMPPNTGLMNVREVADGIHNLYYTDFQAKAEIAAMKKHDNPTPEQIETSLRTLLNGAVERLRWAAGFSGAHQFYDFVIFAINHGFAEQYKNGKSITDVKQMLEFLYEKFAILNTFLVARKESLTAQINITVLFPFFCPSEQYLENLSEEEEEYYSQFDLDTISELSGYGDRGGIYFAPMASVSVSKAAPAGGQYEIDALLKIKHALVNVKNSSGTPPTLQIVSSSGTTKTYERVEPQSLQRTANSEDNTERANSHADLFFEFDGTRRVYISIKNSKFRYWAGVNLERLGGISNLKVEELSDKLKKKYIGRQDIEAIFLKSKKSERYFSDLRNFAGRLVLLFAALDPRFRSGKYKLSNKDVQKIIDFVKKNLELRYSQYNFLETAEVSSEDITFYLKELFRSYVDERRVAFKKGIEYQGFEFNYDDLLELSDNFLQRLINVLYHMVYMYKRQAISYRANWEDFENYIKEEADVTNNTKFQFWSMIYDESFIYRSFFGEERKDSSSPHSAENVNWIFTGDFEVEEKPDKNTVVIRPSTQKEKGAQSYIVLSDEFKRFSKFQDKEDLYQSGIGKYIDFLAYNYPILYAHRSRRKSFYNINNLYVYVGPISNVIGGRGEAKDAFLKALADIFIEGILTGEGEGRELILQDTLSYLSDRIQEANLRENENIEGEIVEGDNIEGEEGEKFIEDLGKKNLTFRLEKDGDEKVFLSRLKSFGGVEKEYVFFDFVYTYNFVVQHEEFGSFLLNSPLVSSLNSEWVARVELKAKTANVPITTPQTQKIQEELSQIDIAKKLNTLEENVLALKNKASIFSPSEEHVLNFNNVYIDFMKYLIQKNKIFDIIPKIVNVDASVKNIKNILLEDAQKRAYVIQNEINSIMSKKEAKKKVEVFVSNIQYNDNIISKYVLFHAFSALTTLKK